MNLEVVTVSEQDQTKYTDRVYFTMFIIHKCRKTTAKQNNSGITKICQKKTPKITSFNLEYE